MKFRQLLGFFDSLYGKCQSGDCTGRSAALQQPFCNRPVKMRYRNPQLFASFLRLTLLDK
jgi:hypothetical protein